MNMMTLPSRTPKPRAAAPVERLGGAERLEHQVVAIERERAGPADVADHERQEAGRRHVAVGGDEHDAAAVAPPEAARRRRRADLLAAAPGGLRLLHHDAP